MKKNTVFFIKTALPLILFSLYVPFSPKPFAEEKKSRAEHPRAYCRKRRIHTRRWRFTYRRLDISGLRRTKECIIRRDEGITQGQPLSSFKPDVFINRFKRKGLFRYTKLAYIKEAQETYNIQYGFRLWKLGWLSLLSWGMTGDLPEIFTERPGRHC